MKKSLVKNISADLERITKLHPLQKEKVLRELIIEGRNKKLLNILNEELKKTEFEQEHVERLENIPAKKPEKNEEELSKIVQAAPRLEEESKSKKETKINELYGANIKPYEIYTLYEQPKEEHFQIQVTSTSSEEKNNSNLAGAENLSTDLGLRKISELYKPKTKKEHEH